MHVVYTVVKLNDLNSYQQSLSVRQDAVIDFGNPETAHINSIQRARLITYYDNATGKELYFITNDFKLVASTIANIYKKRWQIELLFKRIKQNFQVYSFLGDKENAIKIQLSCTFIADLLVKIIKDQIERKKKWSMAHLSSLIRLHLSTYLALFDFLANPDKSLLNYKSKPDADEYVLQSNKGGLGIKNK